MVKKIFTKSLFSHTLFFDGLYKHVKTGQKQNLMYAQRKSFGTTVYLNPISTGLFYLVVALGGGGVPPPSIKFNPDILEY